MDGNEIIKAETAETIDKAKNQQRGEKTIDAMDRGEKIARLDELKKQLAALEAKQAEIEKRIAALEGKKDTPAPAAEDAPTPAPTPESNPTPENTPPQNDAPTPIIKVAPKTGEYPSPIIEKADQQSSANILPTTDEYPSPAIERETKKKAKKNNGIKRFFASVAAISLAGILSFGFAKQKEAGASRPQTATEQDAGTATPSEIEKAVDETITETAADSSEKDQEKSYDYGWWQKRQKEIYFGQDCLDCYGNPELTKERILEATNGGMPEILAAYVKTEDGGFTKKEQEELGIYNMSYEELDDYLSNTNDLDAAVIKRKIADMIADKVNGKNTIIDYESVNEPQKSFYLNKNSDGDPTPENMKLYLDDYVERHGSKQALIYEVDENGNKTLLWRLNLKCGLQPTTTIKRSYKKKTQTPPQTIITPAQTPEATSIVTPAEIKEDVPPVTIQTPFEFGPTGGSITTPDYVVPDTFTPTPAPGGGSSSETPQVEHAEPKNYENMTRIDNQIAEDTASNIHSNEVNVGITENVEAVEERTSRPSSESEANIAQNGSSRETETISQSSESSGSDASESTVNTVSSESNYSEDRGGANAGNAEPNPVEADTEDQERANREEIEQASGSEVSDVLASIGITNG